MYVKEISDIKEILPLHKEIFGEDFPIESYHKKCTKSKLYIFVYEEKSRLFGYSIIVDQKEEKNLYAWYGGVLPELQGKGITQVFFKKLISFAESKSYISITLASTNIRPHMLRLAIKMGFDIYDLKKRESGDGNKIYFKYKILPSYDEDIYMLREDNTLIKPAELEKILVVAYKKNCKTIKLHYATKDLLIYVIKYCNSFLKKPQIIVYTSKDNIIFFSTFLKDYHGEIKILEE